MKPEAYFYNQIKSAIGDICHLQRIETSTALGVPDLNLCYFGTELWIELKITKHKTGDYPLLTPFQYAWGIQRLKHFGNSLVLSKHLPTNTMNLRTFRSIEHKRQKRFVKIISPPDLVLEGITEQGIREFFCNNLFESGALKEEGQA